MDKTDKRKISDVERLIIEEKPWQLKGEVGAHARPVNSLLFEGVGFEQRIKAPVISQETTETLESIIKQRIKDNSYDDPVRKVKPTTSNSNREIEVSSEKSKIGLAQLYEQELVAKVTKGQTKEGPGKDVEKKLLALCKKLDALCDR